ncbi:OsmC family protein [Roseibium aestuarii]|uniref:OsmC family protein n=1 Tax=Roseibium aestuarii TaxID=2600299 RepID=A0ABW4JUC4_9HYPH|nr:OsmC family protein [Roseibium aestuarii]
MTGHLHTAEVLWSLEGDLEKGRYSRAHVWRFDGGAEVAASASPSVVPLPWSSPAGVDPEEAFLAAVSSCHMLTFIDIARRKGVKVLRYEDHAEGLMEVIDPDSHPKRMGITRVTLNPVLTLAGAIPPDPALMVELHEEAHALCFIANSVSCEIVVAAHPVVMAG